MEESRKSNINENEFQAKKHLFYEFFQKKYNINSNDIVNEENLVFLNQFSSNNLLFDIYCKSRDSIEGELTLDVFIDDIVQTIKVLHWQIIDENTKINKMKENSRVIEMILKKMETKNEESMTISPATVMISYVKDKKFESDIFKVCRLKYKVSINSDKMLSIYSEKKKKICVFTVTQDLKTIFIHILAKKLENNYEDEFKIIASAEVSLKSLYSAIKPLFFELDDIPPIYQIINYVYDREDDFVGAGDNQIDCCFELKFEFKANNQEKIRIMRCLLSYYPDLIIEMENLVNERIILIQDLLLPFEGCIIYDKNSDVMLRKSLDRSCSICYLI